MNKAILPAFTCCLFIFIFFLIIGPRLPDSLQRNYCVHNIYFSKYFGFSLNCDSSDFIMIANNPKIILDKNNVRQDRPGSIFFISAIRFALSMLHLESNGYVNLKIGKEMYKINIMYIYIYFYYIILNILILLLSFYIFFEILKIGKKNKWILFFFGLLFIYNDIVKAFIISPHSQIFNILAPIFCLWFFILVVEKNIFERPVIFFAAALTGFLVTAYASFFLFLPSVLIPAIATQRPYRMAKTSRFALRSFFITILIILPSLIWYSYVLYKTGNFYSHSTKAYHHIVWMKDAFKDGTFTLISKLLQNTFNLFLFTAKQGWILLLILIPFIFGRAERKIQWKTALRSPIVIGSIFISTMFLVFFAMVGLIAERVAYTAIPPMIVLTFYITQQIEQKSTSLAYRLTPIIIFAYGIYEIVKDGPYS